MKYGARNPALRLDNDLVLAKFPLRALFLLLLMLLGACGGDDKKPQAQPPVLVSVAEAKLMDVPLTVSAIGHVEALNVIKLRSQVTGYLQKIHVKDGEYVKRGQRLVTIDPAPFEASVRQAEANLARDRAAAEQAERDYSRYADLIKKAVISQNDYEQFRTNAVKAKEQVGVDEANLATAKLNLGFCYIDSPLDGVLGYSSVDQGNLVTANSDQLFTLTQVQPIYVKYSLPEAELPRLRKYMDKAKLRTEVRFQEGSSEPNSVGELTAIDNSVDVQSGMILLQSEFKNTDKMLWPGQYVNVTLILTVEPDQIAVPTNALISRQEQFLAFVLKPDSTVELRTLATGRRFGKLTLVKQGLSPGEKIVTEGLVRLYPGAKVELKPENPAEPAKPKAETQSGSENS